MHAVHDLRLRGLAALARNLSRSAELDVIIELAADGSLDPLDAASVSISRQEPGTGIIRTLLNAGRLGPTEERWPKDEIYQLDKFVVGNMWADMADGYAVGDLRIMVESVDDPAADPEEVRLLCSLHKAASISAPLVVDGRVWGEFYATREAGAAPFDSSDEAFIEALIAILSGAISRAISTDSLRRLALLDPHTGVANRRALDAAAAIAFDPAAGTSVRLISAVTFDVNGLKDVNDTFGHEQGDRLLTRIAALLNNHFADLHGSLVARVGGDEFTVLIPVHAITKVVAAAESACIAAALLPAGGGLSCGVATTIRRGPDAARLLFKAADAAQYEAKRQGRLTPVIAAVPHGNHGRS